MWLRAKYEQELKGLTEEELRDLFKIEEAKKIRRGIICMIELFVCIPLLNVVAWTFNEQLGVIGGVGLLLLTVLLLVGAGRRVFSSILAKDQSIFEEICLRVKARQITETRG